VREALNDLWERHAGLKDRVLTEQGDVRQHVNIFVNSSIVRRDQVLDAPLKDTAEICIMPAVSGGLLFKSAGNLLGKLIEQIRRCSQTISTLLPVALRPVCKLPLRIPLSADSQPTSFQDSFHCFTALWYCGAGHLELFRQHKASYLAIKSSHSGTPILSPAPVEAVEVPGVAIDSLR
jgi:molybdopterin converting factor small subunit